MSGVTTARGFRQTVGCQPSFPPHYYGTAPASELAARIVQLEAQLMIATQTLQSAIKALEQIAELERKA